MARRAAPTKASRATVSKAATRRGSVTRLGRIWLSTMLRRAAAKSVISRSIPRCCGPLAFSASVYKRPGARKQRTSAAGSQLDRTGSRQYSFGPRRRPGGRVVIQRTANPCTPVRFRPGPPPLPLPLPASLLGLSCGAARPGTTRAGGVSGPWPATDYTSRSRPPRRRRRRCRARRARSPDARSATAENHRFHSPACLLLPLPCAWCPALDETVSRSGGGRQEQIENTVGRLGRCPRGRARPQSSPGRRRGPVREPGLGVQFAKPHGRTEARTIRQDILVCLPEPLHPVSRMFLEHWLAGDLATAEFLRWFHMPNSDYLAVAECVLAVVAAS